jgi:probable HAF family extracellular repeat protein
MNRFKCHAHRTILPLIVLGAASICVYAASSTDPKYRITDIGTLGGTFSAGTLGLAMNQSGQITGYSDAGGDAWRAFLWRNDGSPMVNLGPAESAGVTIQDSRGVAINASGQVAGWVDIAINSNGSSYAFVWRNDGTPMLNLGTLGGQSSYASDINDAGQVVGTAYTAASGGHAFFWRNDGSPMQDLGTFGGSYSEAGAVNNAGQVAGESNKTGDHISHAFLWRNNGTPLLNIGTLGGYNRGASCINASGQMGGWSEIKPGDHDAHAFFWRNNGTAMIDLGSFGLNNSSVSKLNDSGQAVGAAQSITYPNPSIAFAWMNDGTPTKNLGTLGGIHSGSSDINASGWVVGSSTIAGDIAHGFLWKNDGNGMRDLNNLIDPADPLKPYIVFTSADAINDAGDIMASGYDITIGSNVSHTYYLRGTSLVLSPRAIAFGNQKVGTTSATQAISVQNVSTSAVPITGVALAGSGATQFAQTHNCGKSVMAKGSCTIKVTFKPTSKGAKAATLSVNGGGGGLRVVNLTGTGS